MNSPTFSVIIPAYNAAMTIKAAIESCLQQTLLPDEIIVIDDYSTDETEQVVTTFGTQVRYIKLLKNSGSAVARNKGLDSAVGTYIAFLDADDIWHPSKLAIMASILSSGQNINFIYHTFTLNNINDVAVPDSAVLYKMPFIRLLRRNPIATPCAVIKNDKNYRFEPSMRYMEDYDLWLRIAYKQSVYFVDIPLTQLGRPVLSEGGVSSDKWKMRKGELKAYTRLIKLNPLYIFSLPFLYTYSLGKHLVKLIAEN